MEENSLVRPDKKERFSLNWTLHETKVCMYMTNNMKGISYKLKRRPYLPSLLMNGPLAMLICLALATYASAHEVFTRTNYIAWTNGNSSDDYDGLSAVYTTNGHGPWTTFYNVNLGAYPTNNQLTNGCLLLVLPNVIVENSNGTGPFTTNTEYYNAVPRINASSGTSNQPIVISNYMGGLVIWANCGPNAGFEFSGVAWLKVSPSPGGFQFTNNYRSPGFAYSANCEFCNVIGGGNGCIGVGGPQTLDLFIAADW
jgi:hypothetical protein